MSEKDIGIYARKLLEMALKKIGEIDGSQEKKFPEILLVEIDRDIDGAGYMLYEKALIVRVNGNVWALSLGVASGDYQADLYDSDIMAIKILSGDSIETIAERIKKENHFKSSLIIARNSGILYVRENCFCESVRKALRGVLPEFLIRAPKFDRENIDISTLGSPVIEQALYRQELAKVLSKKLIEVLENS